MDFKIDKEFKKLIPPLSEEEFSQLERSILQEGVRDPLVVWSNNGTKSVLIEGHHRLQLIKKHGIKDFIIIEREFEDRDAVRCWIIDNQCGRRNLPRFTRTMLQIQKSEFLLRQESRKKQGERSDLFVNSRKSSPTHVDEELAKAAGVSSQTIHRIRFLMENADNETAAALKRVDISINEAFKAARNVVRRAERQEASKKGLEAFQGVKVDGHMNVHLGDFRKVSMKIEDASVDLILTDPPYDADSIPLYGDLAEMASRVLKPGGSLITYCGNKYLPEVLNMMTPHLKFYWSMSCLHTGGVAHEQHHRNVGIIGRQKPVLWFVKEKRGDRLDFIADAIEGEMDKRYHPWGQSVMEAKYFIEHLTKPNDEIYDPMVGGGTVCVAAKRLKRRWIGCDIDKAAVTMSRQRLAKMDMDGDSDDLDEQKPTVTAYVGNNAVLFREVAQMYLQKGDKVADVTYGKGVFWRDIDTSQYDFHPSDIMTSFKKPYDFKKLPYEKEDFDCVVLDPPYAHNPSSNMMVDDNYQNSETTKGFYHKDIMELYLKGMREAKRVLKNGGLLMVKCQDEIETSRQRRSHMEIHAMAMELGMTDEDLFVLVQPHRPTIQHKEQKHARKNHSCLSVFRK